MQIFDDSAGDMQFPPTPVGQKRPAPLPCGNENPRKVLRRHNSKSQPRYEDAGANSVGFICVVCLCCGWRVNIGDSRVLWVGGGGGSMIQLIEARQQQRTPRRLVANGEKPRKRNMLKVAATRSQRSCQRI